MCKQSKKTRYEDDDDYDGSDHNRQTSFVKACAYKTDYFCTIAIHTAFFCSIPSIFTPFFIILRISFHSFCYFLYFSLSKKEKLVKCLPSLLKIFKKGNLPFHFSLFFISM